MKTVLVLGVGQIGKAITKRIIEQNPERIILHNLTKTESGYCCKYFSEYCKNIELIPSYGDVFLPFEFRGREAEKGGLAVPHGKDRRARLRAAPCRGNP